MLTLFRLAKSRFSGLVPVILLLALGSFDTVRAQSLTLSTNTLQFNAAQGNNPSPVYQTVNTSTTGAAINFLITTNQTWLLASTGAFGGNGGTSGQSITVQINSLSLAVGTYTGVVTLTPTSGSSAATITVTLTVTGSAPATTTLVASLTTLNFGYELGLLGPPSQGVQITTTGINLPVTSVNANAIVTGGCPSGWLQASTTATTTPAKVTIAIATTGLAVGQCYGSVTVGSSSAGNGTTSVKINVYLTVATTPLMNVTIPAGLTPVTAQLGAQNFQVTVPVTGTDPNNPVTFTAATDSNWMAVAPVSGSTPANLLVQFFPAKVPSAGTYNGNLTITAPGFYNGQYVIPITFNVVASSGVTVAPSGTQSFTVSQLGSAPAPIVLTLSGTVNSLFTAAVTQQTGGLWLAVTPANGSVTPTTQGMVTLSLQTGVQNSLSVGTYQCLLTITFQNSGIQPITIPVSLTVNPPVVSLNVSPSSLTFNYQTGATAAPPPQTVNLTNPASGVINYTVGSISQSWLSVAPQSGSTPGSVSVSVAPQGLAPGTYTGTFVLSATNVSPDTVTVTLNVTQSATPQVFIIGNAASGVGGQLAPGEIITIKGSQLGPTTPQVFSQSTLSQPTLGGVGVNFSGFNGTLLYVSSGQINVTVPYEVAGMATTTIVVTYNGVSSAGITQNVASSALGLFTANSTGTGQASILNQNYSINGSTLPAAQGSYISVYATGGGQTVPASSDAEVTPTTSLFPLALSPYVTATIGGKNAPVVFAGAAPGFVTGLVQFNIQVPTGVSGPALPIVITINGSTAVQSQSGTTVAVQ